MDQTFGDELADLTRGHDVPVGSSKVTVFPVSVTMIPEFSAGIAAAVAEIGQLVSKFPRDVETGKILFDGQLGKVAPMIARAVSGSCIGLVLKCCTPTDVVGRLPHWKFPPILAKWIELNFDSEEKVRPWVQAAEEILGKALKQRVELWETLSKALSPAVMTSIKSSISGVRGGPTSDGASGSSDTGKQERSGTSSSDGQS